MRSALIIGVSVLALGLGGCSWVERTTGLGGGSDQSAAQAEPAQPAQSSAMSGTSQAPAPVPQNRTAAATAGSGSTMHHPMHASNDVRMAQQKLKDDGDYMGKIDGLAGPQTRQALMQYQKKNGLKETGHLDHATLSKLGAGAASSGSSMPPAAGSTGGASDNGSNGSSGSSPAPATGNGGGNSATPAGGNGHQL